MTEEKPIADKVIFGIIIKALEEAKIPPVSALAGLMSAFGVMAAKMGLQPKELDKFLEVLKVSYSNLCLSMFKEINKENPPNGK